MWHLLQASPSAYSGNMGKWKMSSLIKSKYICGRQYCQIWIIVNVYKASFMQIFHSSFKFYRTGIWFFMIWNISTVFSYLSVFLIFHAEFIFMNFIFKKKIYLYSLLVMTIFCVLINLKKWYWMLIYFWLSYMHFYFIKLKTIKLIFLICFPNASKLFNTIYKIYLFYLYSVLLLF